MSENQEEITETEKILDRFINLCMFNVKVLARANGIKDKNIADDLKQLLEMNKELFMEISGV